MGGTEGRLNKLTEELTSGNSHLCSTGHRPFGAAAQKAEQKEEQKNFQQKEGDKAVKRYGKTKTECNLQGPKLQPCQGSKQGQF